MQEHDKIYIDGAWVPSQGSGTIDVFDSTNGEVFGRIPNGNAADVDAAAKAAHAAFPEWSAKSPEERWQTAADLHRELKWVAESIVQDASAKGAGTREKALWPPPRTV